MDKKKLPFVRLSIVFILIILSAIFVSWGYNKESKSDMGMMGNSMGEMMGENHLQEITIRDLIVQEEQLETTQGDEHSQHHNSNTSLLSTLHKITTITIAVIIPFIIAGTVFLMIIWFDQK